VSLVRDTGDFMRRGRFMNMSVEIKNSMDSMEEIVPMDFRTTKRKKKKKAI
jgi:hypothetical protein